MPIPVVVRNHDAATQASMELIMEAMGLCQLIYGLSSLKLAAVLGQAAGQGIGCLDARAESDPNRRDIVEEGIVDIFKETVLKNFDYAYNDHRAFHEREGNKCAVKPEPKIV